MDTKQNVTDIASCLFSLRLVKVVLKNCETFDVSEEIELKILKKWVLVDFFGIIEPLRTQFFFRGWRLTIIDLKTLRTTQYVIKLL